MQDYQYHIFSPYRVCPLGAHVDHQHGLVTGFAIDKGVDLWFNVRQDATVRLSSRTFDGDVEFEINKASIVKEGMWGDYARGAKYALRKHFELTYGIEGVIQGCLPVGGASSSGMASHKQIERDHKRALKEHGVYSNFLLVGLRYLYKIGELVMAKLS